MPDPMGFEARVQTAYDRWLEELPTGVDALALVRATHRDHVRVGVVGRLAKHWLGPIAAERPARLILILLLALTAVAGLVVGALLREQPPQVSLREGWLPAGTYVSTPFAQPGGLGLCMQPPQPGCVESTDDDDIGFTMTLPDGWAGAPRGGVRSGGETDGLGIFFERGGWLHEDPCVVSNVPGIPVGPGVEDFTAALVAHPDLDVSDPIPATLGGSEGQFVELRPGPGIGACEEFRPWAPGIDEVRAYRTPDGADWVWRLWVLDVAGSRVVVRSSEDVDVAPETRSQVEAVLDSIEIADIRAAPQGTTGGRLPPSCSRSSGESLAPGRYVMPGPGYSCYVRSRGWPDKTVSVEIPAGWGYRHPAFGSALDGRLARLQMGVVDHVWADPCHRDRRAEQGTSGAGSAVTGATTGDLVAALGAMRGVQVTDPEPVTLDGHAGVRMDLAMPTGPSEAECEWHRLWDTETDNGTFGTQSGTGWIHRLWILEVDGVRFVLDASRAPETRPEVQAELDAIVGSVEFEP